MTEEVGIVVKARDQASATLGKTRAELDKTTQDVNKLRAAFKSGTGDAQALGVAMQKQAELARRLGAEHKAVAAAKMQDALSSRSLAEALAGQNAAAASAVRAFSGLSGGALLAAAGIAAAAAALIAGAKGIADYQEKLDIAAESTGLTTGQLAGLRVAASESGRSFEQIRPALDYFTRKIGEAGNGSKEAIASFSALGVGVKDASGAIRPTGDVLRDVQDKLNAIAAPAERSRIAMELFGRSGAASIGVLLTPLDEAEKRARKLGLALGPDAEKVARDADKAFDAMGTSLQGVGNAFGVAAAKILNPYLTALAKASSAAAAFANNPNVQDPFAGLWLNLTMGLPPQFHMAMAAFKELDALAKGFTPPVAPKGMPATPAGAEGATQGELTEVQRTVGVMSGFFEGLDNLKQMSPVIDEAQKAFDELTAAIKLSAEIIKIKDRQFWEAEDKIMAMPKTKRLDRFDAVFQGEAPGGGPQGAIPKDLTAQGIEDYTKRKDASEKALKKAEEESAQLLENMMSNLKSSFGVFVSDAIRGVGSLSDAFDAFVDSALDQLIQTGVAALFKSIGLQGGGTYVGMQQGGSWANAYKAQSGLAVSGVRGVDNLPVLMGRGERIISHAENDYMNAVLGKLDTFIGRMGSGGQAGGGQSVVNLNLRDGAIRIDSGLNDPMVVRELAQKLVYEIPRAVRYGQGKRA